METARQSTAKKDQGSVVWHPEKQHRSSFLKITDSVKQQLLTEDECEPYFVPISTMTISQLDHLWQTGLLHPVEPGGASLLDASKGEISASMTFDSVFSMTPPRTASSVQSDDWRLCLVQNRHIDYLSRIWTSSQLPLRPSFVSLDSSRTWMIYWTLHGCDLMNHSPPTADVHAIVSTLSRCFTETSVVLPKSSVEADPLLMSLQSSLPHRKNGNAVSSTTDDVSLRVGGFGGGPGQMAHAATTYAAVLALSILASREPMALRLLEDCRHKLYGWMVSLHQPDGSFRMHHDGEVDVRATYCLVAVASLLDCLSPLTLARPETTHFLAACQTFEGGFGAEPFSEAHGGYTYCATAALRLLHQDLNHFIDLPALRGWLARRQMSFEGGFSGRTNKLVDGCYSFWQGAALALVSTPVDQGNKEPDSSEDQINKSGDRALLHDPWLRDDDSVQQLKLLFDQEMLERYILSCAQDVQGGLRDKPSKPRDFYHSCYNLSGLSVAQHYDVEGSSFGHHNLSKVARTHPCYNIRIEHTKFVLEHFRKATGASLQAETGSD